MQRHTRFILATPICDGHDVAVCAITRILRAEGADAVYIGFNRSPYQIVKAAVEEDAAAIAISTYNGGHMSFLRETIREAKKQGIPGIPLFCGGGGTILAREVKPLERMGVAKVYRPPMDLVEVCRDMMKRATDRNGTTPVTAGDDGDWLVLARRLSQLEYNGKTGPRTKKKQTGKKTGRGSRAREQRTPVWGICGRGGAGKSTLIDEIVDRFLRSSDGTIAVLAIDPTLGDRLRMLHCYSPRVFLRSVALRPGEPLQRKVTPLIEALRARPFDLVLVESVGVGQNDLGVQPFVDGSVFCMTPEYGTDVQLEKEALLGCADIVVMNKSDYPQAGAKGRRVRQFLRSDQDFVSAQAKQHMDPGVTQLFGVLARRAGVDVRVESGELQQRRVTRDQGVPFARRAYLGEIVQQHEDYYAEMEDEIRAVRKNDRKAGAFLKRFQSLWKTYGFDGDLTEFEGQVADGSDVLIRETDPGEQIPVARKTTCDIWVPTIGLPEANADASQVVRYLYKQNVPGQFPFTEGAYEFRRQDEDPIRMFAGLGLPETTNERFHLLAGRGGPPRLSTAFDSLTLYGLDSDEPGAIAKIGEGGVAVDTIDDMLQLYDGFDLEGASVSMTINGPAPTLLALYLAAARRRKFDWRKLRGTVQTDILKEIQAQNECIFPLETSLRLISDMVEFTMEEAPRWYPLSVSGYHIGEAGANPIQELAFTLANGFTYMEILKNRGLPLEEVARRFSFFFTTGSELEFNVLGRVARRIWAVAMKRRYGIDDAASQRLKFHSQTSGKSLQDTEPLHNLARVTLQAEHALHNGTNSLHTNSYKETYTTPEEEDVKLAMGCQQIPLLESGDYRFTENLHQGAYGLSYIEDEVERAVQRIFREIDRQGGVIPAIENEYFRSEIQEEIQKEIKARQRDERTIVGVNYLNFGTEERPRGKLVTIPMAEKRKQVNRTREFKRRHKKKAAVALRHLQEVAASDGNLFAELVKTVEVATVGQVTHALWEVCGRFRPYV